MVRLPLGAGAGAVPRTARWGQRGPCLPIGEGLDLAGGAMDGKGHMAH